MQILGLVRVKYINFKAVKAAHIYFDFIITNKNY